MTKAITMWRFEDAPAVLRALSTNGGDEDWLAIVPKALLTYGLPAFMESTSFACEDGLQKYEYPDLENDIIVISSHA
jgi:hypothetical protein